MSKSKKTKRRVAKPRAVRKTTGRQIAGRSKGGVRFDVVDIAKIKIGDRVRKAMGDIEGLARSIEDGTLLQAVAITKNGTLHRAPDRHYDTMRFQEMMELAPLVKALAADDCVMFPWVPGTRDLAAHQLLPACGFEFKRSDAITWLKTLGPVSPEEEKLHAEGYCSGEEKLDMGMGYNTRAESERCWLARRGQLGRIDRDVREVVFAPVGGPSEKPAEVRRRIERLFPGPYLELFATKKVDGWTCWGNEIGPPDDLDVAPEVLAAVAAEPVVARLQRPRAANDVAGVDPESRKRRRAAARRCQRSRRRRALQRRHRAGRRCLIRAAR
jgi:N6-adenosine-specific RNA methylase IME4